MAQSRALTLAEVADRLGVKPQRISQMLRDRILKGPDVGPGRARKGAGRVWESSLTAEETRRQAATDRQAASGNVSKRRSDSRAGSGQGLSGSAAVLALKVRLDAARDALREERRANQRLTRQLADAVAEIQAAQTQTDRLDEIAEGYSEALTHFGTPDDPSALS